MKRDREETKIDMANCLMLLSEIGQADLTNKSSVTGKSFTCKTCNKKFPSFQALGGHRASHNKPKFLKDDVLFKLATSPPKSKTHQCPICGLDFPIGQALGGHMRRHKPATSTKKMLHTKNTTSGISNSSTISTGEELDISQVAKVTKKSSCIIFGVDFNAIVKETDLDLELGKAVLDKRF